MMLSQFTNELMDRNKFFVNIHLTEDQTILVNYLDKYYEEYSIVEEDETYLRTSKKCFFYIEKHFSDSSAFLISFCPWCGKELSTKVTFSKSYELTLKKKDQLELQKFDEKISEGLRREILRKHYEHLKRLKYFGFADRLTLHNFKFDIY